MLRVVDSRLSLPELSLEAVLPGALTAHTIRKELGENVSNYRRISKLLSLMLRHRSEEFGLEMDSCGFVSLEEVVVAVQERYPDLGEEDVYKLVEEPGQHRFEISERGIRALYGHSFFVEMDGEPIKPPDRLYMWCSVKDAKRFRQQGIKPKDRFYVHLSIGREEAETRSRKVDAPCIIEVLTAEAYAAGVKFFMRGEVILTDAVPAEFVGQISGLEEGTANGAEQARPQTAMSYGRRMRKSTRTP
ncbi:MAG: hypothetical protein CME16_00285 [Gemmatimonadetes bacterium]|nr:hypothetical protein [Gemmatimonadota bacterium]